MIYVDPLFVMPSKDRQAFYVGLRHGHQWCHMWCDGDLKELHRMARQLGLKKEWFQDKPGFPHYDLVPPRRVKAIELGAKEMNLREWLANHKPQPVAVQEALL